MQQRQPRVNSEVTILSCMNSKLMPHAVYICNHDLNNCVYAIFWSFSYASEAANRAMHAVLEKVAGTQHQNTSTAWVCILARLLSITKELLCHVFYRSSSVHNYS